MRARIALIARFALALATAASAAAGAQDVPAVISPLRVESDHNGVNLVDGRTVMETPVLAVPGAPNLRFDRVQNAAPYVSGRVSTPSGSEIDQRTYSVHTGTGTSDSFECYNYDCASVTGTGSTFAWNERLYRQAGSGAVWQFNLRHVQTPSPNQSLLYYASNVTYPNGEVITYSYQTYDPPGDPYNRRFYRPITIASNLGYFISIGYQSDDFNSNGWGQPGAATLYASAAPATPLGRLTYAGNTITDLGGRVFTCGGCNDQLGVDIEVGAGTSQLPGETSPTLQVTALAGAPIVGSVIRDGVPWTYSYDNLHFAAATNAYLYDRVTVAGPNGYHDVYEMTNVRNRNAPTRATDSLNRATSYTVDASYRPTRIVYPEGNAVSVAYDQNGNIVSRTASPKPGSGLPDIAESAYFPSAGCAGVLCYRPLWTRDGLGRQTDYAYNANGQLTEQTDPADASGVRRKTYIAYGTSTGLSRRSVVRVCGDTTTCGTNAEIRTEYDYWGNTFLPSAERRIDASSGTTVTLDTSHGYDAAGRLLSTDGPLPGSGDTVYNRYDIYGRRIWEIGAAAANGLRIATRTTYRDADDRPIYTETGTIPNAASTNLAVFRRTDFAYDSRRNPARETVSAAGTAYSVLQRSFDDRGQLVCEARRMNPAIFAALPADACAPGAQGSPPSDYGPDRITRNVYDAAGQRLQLREGVGTADEAAAASWTYNPNGTVRTLADGNGNTNYFGYDGHDRRNYWVLPSATSTGSWDWSNFEYYEYDAAGNRTRLRRRDGWSLYFAYDNLDRMIVKIVPERPGLTAGQTRDVYYAYDLMNNQTRARFDSIDGDGITNSYDGFGRLRSSNTTAGALSWTLSYQYDPAGNRTQVMHPDGQAFDYLYDSLGRPTHVLGPAGWAMNVTYYDHGAPWVMTRSNATWSALYYDQIQRLSTLILYPAGNSNYANFTYSRDPAGGLRSVTRDNDAYAWTGHYAVNRAYATNGLNQYTAAGAASFSYDANGNLTGDGARSYVYDVENRLVSASPNVTLSYDPLGRLASTTGVAGTTRFLYDGDALVAEYDGAGNLLRRYAHWVGADVPLVWYEGAGLADPRHLYADERGSIVAITSSTGAPPAINRYDEYGIPAATNVGRFQYTGQAWLAELGMYYYKARIYSPTLGRFLQTDPIGYQGGINLYGYVGDDPLNGRDPTGRAAWGCDRSPICPLQGTTQATVQPASGGPLNGTRVDPRRLTQPDARNANSVALYYGGYYEQGPDGLTWHSLAEEAARDMGVLSLSILGGEAIGSIAVEVRGLRSGATLADQAYHYTFSRYASSIAENGLRPGSFATTTSGLSPLQAQLDLALAPGRGLTDTIVTIDLNGLRGAGYQIPEAAQVGRSFNMPGGGVEMQFPYAIPPEFIRVPH